jgi:hypothetical protein
MTNKTHVLDLSITGHQYHNSNLPCVFVQYWVLERVSDRVPEQVLDQVSDQVWTKKHGAFFPVIAKKHELTLGNHKI